MFTIEKVEDFKLFIASERAKNEVEPMIARAKKSNQEYLVKNSSVAAQMPITGTFIYPHPPNYRGRPMHHYSTDDWANIMQELNALGMDTVILQASVWNELGECYYPSKHFSSCKQWNVVEPMLKAASTVGMSVYLGSYGSVTGWKECLTQEDIDREKCNQVSCFRELMKYKELFDGIYFVPETAFTGKRDREKEKFLNEVYVDFCETVKREAPDKKILMSPATKYYHGKMPEMVESWLAILDGVPLDFMAPQDSIGTCGNQLRHQEATYRSWAEICRRCDITFWSNIEVFERNDFISGTDYNSSASPERVAAQINSAAPYSQKLICWEAPHYILGNAPGNECLRRFIKKMNVDCPVPV